MLEHTVEKYGSGCRCGYDIGCDFRATLRDSILGEDFKRVTMVNALMHSFAHDWQCQLQFNPRRILSGIDGMTDYEDNERLYKFMNGCASTCRVSSRWHRAQKIERQLDLYNADRLEYLGKCNHTFDYILILWNCFATGKNLNSKYKWLLKLLKWPRNF